MKTEEFKTWLQARRWRGQPLSAKSIQHRRSRLKRVERSLGAMGFSDADLDKLILRGDLPALLSKLSSYIGSRESAPPVSLVPLAENPDGQLRNLVAATRRYGRFANGEDPDAHDPEADDVEDDGAEVESDADDIRAAALKLYINPTRLKGKAEVSIR